MPKKPVAPDLEDLEEDLDATNGTEEEDEEAGTEDTASKPSPPSGKLKVIKFGAPWCPACRTMDYSRSLEKLARAHPDDLTVEKVDCDRDGAKADAYKVKEMPTIVIEDWAGVEVARKKDALDLAGLEKLLRKAKLKIAARSK